MDACSIQKLLPFQLPEWFSLDNYDNTHKYRAIDWARCFYARKQLKDYIEQRNGIDQDIFLQRALNLAELAHAGSKLNKIEEDNEYKLLEQRALNIVHEKIVMNKGPVNTPSVREIIKSFDFVSSSNEYKQLLDTLPRYDEYDEMLQSVIDTVPKNSPMRIVAMASLAKMFAKGESTERNILLEQISLLEKPLSALTHSENSAVFINTDKALIEVNLGCTNDEPLNEFKEKIISLKKKNKNSVKKNEYNDKDYKKWIDNMVLLYIDLISLAEIFNARIEDHEALTILYENEKEPIDQGKITKTLKSYVKKILDDNTINALFVQAKKEEK